MRPRIDARRAAALLTACVLALVCAQPAAAHRAPTKGERKAIRKAIVRACEKVGDDARCHGARGVRVSTANRRYAIGGPRGTGGWPVRYHVGLRKSRGRWKVVWEEINDLFPLPCSTYRKHFPNAVIRDFRLDGFPGRWGAAPPVPCWKRR